MDEDILTLLSELSLRSTAASEDENGSSGHGSRFFYNQDLNPSSSSNLSSPLNGNFSNSIADEDLELKEAVSSLLHDLKPTQTSNLEQNPSNLSVNENSNVNGYDKSKLLLALLGNIDLVTCAVKRINSLVSLGKKLEQIYRCYYRDPTCHIDLNELNQLLTTFSDIYNSERYVREVDVSRMYQAYYVKLLDIYNSRPH